MLSKWFSELNSNSRIIQAAGNLLPFLFAPKNKRHFPGLLAFTLVLIITSVLVVSNAALSRSINESDQAADSLLRLQGLAYRLSSLEWQAIASTEISSESAEDIKNTQDEMNLIAGKLIQIDPNSENLQTVHHAFIIYLTATTEEFKLITAGDLEHASLVDEEQVDPAFNTLKQVLSTSNAAYNARSTQMKRVGETGFVLVLFLNTALIALVLWQYQKAERAVEREHSNEIKAVNMELETNQKNLEQRVAERTAELETARQNSEKSARQFKAITQIVHVISSIQDLDTLLPRITQVISEQFNIYHTGIFLLDDRQEFAVLHASNSEGGRKMLKRGHKLQVGQTGIVGFVTATGRARIALDVGADAAYFDNPDLPDTRSEIALPLRYAGRLIGALDVQSTKPNAFGQEDIETLAILADQVAVTINNTHIFEEARKSLTESQSTLNKATRESWKIMRPKSLGLGLRSSGSTVSPLEQPLEGDYIHEAITKDKTVISNKDDAASNLTIPIRLRGQIVGVMSLRTRKNRKLSSDEADIAEAVAERLSLAIETAVLLQSTQHRADLERVTTNISSKIGASTRIETILQTAAQELSRALGGSDVVVQIEPASIELGMAQ